MDEARKMALEDLLEMDFPVTITPLRIPNTNQLIGEISKFWDYGDELFYVADLQIANKVYGFSRDGDLQFVIDDIGEGPGQFQKLWDVQYNLHEKSLQLWDLPLHKMITYSLSGEFVDELRINHEIVSFYPVTKDWYIYHLDGRDHLGEKKPLLRYSDITGKELIKEGAWDYGIVDAFPSKLEFSEYDGSAYFLRAMNDTIYWVGPVNGQICPDYVIDFGEKRIPVEAKKQTDLMEAARLIEKSKSSFNIGNLVVGRTYLHFEWLTSDTEEKFIQLVDRFQYQSYTVKERDLALFGITLEKINFVNLHDFYGYFYPHKVNKDKLQKSIDNPALNKTTRDNLRKILDVEDPEMPVIIKFRLNHPKTYQ